MFRDYPISALLHTQKGKAAKENEWMGISCNEKSKNNM